MVDDGSAGTSAKLVLFCHLDELLQANKGGRTVIHLHSFRLVPQAGQPVLKVQRRHFRQSVALQQGHQRRQAKLAPCSINCKRITLARCDLPLPFTPVITFTFSRSCPSRKKSCPPKVQPRCRRWPISCVGFSKTSSSLVREMSTS